MGGIADFLLALANLIEAEGRTLRRSVLRVIIGILLILVGAWFVFFAFGFWTFCVFALLHCAVGTILAAFLTGIFTILVAGALMVTARVLN